MIIIIITIIVTIMIIILVNTHVTEPLHTKMSDTGGHKFYTRYTCNFTTKNIPSREGRYNYYRCWGNGIQNDW